MAADELELSCALTVNDRTAPLLDGTVKPAGIRLIAGPLGAGDLFWRQLKFAEFDVSEMSLSDLMIATARGNRDWVALPVYTLRRFYHTQVLVHRDAGIARPEDLRGKRVGVPEYQLTSIVWCRGVIADEYGVQPGDMEWFVERLADESHGEATGFTPPPGVRVRNLRPEQNLGEMLIARELDALFHYIPAHNRIDRSRLDLRARADVGTLFPDPAAEGRRYFRATGMYPVNHCVIVRRSILERHPWVGLAVYDAFVAAKEHLDAQGRAALHPFFSAGLLPAGTSAALAADPWAYGLRNSRTAVETIERYLFEQGLLDRRINVEELFLPASLAT